jgi:hypothetical protein
MRGRYLGVLLLATAVLLALVFFAPLAKSGEFGTCFGKKPTIRL